MNLMIPFGEQLCDNGRAYFFPHKEFVCVRKIA